MKNLLFLFLIGSCTNIMTAQQEPEQSEELEQPEELEQDLTKYLPKIKENSCYQKFLSLHTQWKEEKNQDKKKVFFQKRQEMALSLLKIEEIQNLRKDIFKSQHQKT